MSFALESKEKEIKAVQDDEKRLLIDGARLLDVDIDDRQLESLLKLKSLVLKWNKAFRLTAIEDEREFILKHLLDSISVAPFINEGRLIDIGSGAGFPGLVISIIRKDIELCLIEASDKKCGFLMETAKVLELDNARTIKGRIDKKALINELKGNVDSIISRAAISLQELLDVGEKICRPGGRIISMKGRGGSTENKTTLPEGVSLKEKKAFTLPFSDYKRTILVYEKISQDVPRGTL